MGDYDDPAGNWKGRSFTVTINALVGTLSCTAWDVGGNSEADTTLTSSSAASFSSVTNSYVEKAMVECTYTGSGT